MPDVLVPLELARFVRKVWLPANPNRLRGAAPETVAAAKQFIALVEAPPKPEVTNAMLYAAQDECDKPPYIRDLGPYTLKRIIKAALEAM